jgi:hypothetical protein
MLYRYLYRYNNMHMYMVYNKGDNLYSDTCPALFISRVQGQKPGFYNVVPSVFLWSHYLLYTVLYLLLPTLLSVVLLVAMV